MKQYDMTILIFPKYKIKTLINRASWCNYCHYFLQKCKMYTTILVCGMDGGGYVFKVPAHTG